MIKVKMGDLVRAEEVIRSICGERGKHLSVKTARHVGVVLANACEENLRAFHEMRNEIIKEYDNVNTDGVPEVPADKIEDFNEKIEAVFAEERDLLHVRQLADTELECLDLTPAEWRLIDWLVLPDTE